MFIIFTLIICLGITFLSTFLAKKIKISSIVSLIFAGIIIGTPAIKKIILGSNTDFILILGDI